MVLILSMPFDPTTDSVIDWLYSMGVKYNRLNDIDFYQKKRVKILINKKKISIVVSDNDIFINTKAVWLRRWGLTDNDFKINETDINQTSRALINHFKQEFKVLTDVLFMKGKKKFFLTNPNQYEVNKVSTLIKAQNIGLKIPDFIISNDKSGVLDFSVKNIHIITKPLSQLVSFRYKNDFYSSYTSIVNSFSGEISSNLGISFFQKKIEKQYEVRVFYILETCYSMAIFSQFDEKTIVDFRAYNEEKPNRFVPYKLPEEIRKKTINLMRLLRLDTGSLDFLVSTEGEFFFLEVNPVGQFGMVSFPCNYNLEKIVAEKIKNKIQRND